MTALLVLACAVLTRGGQTGPPEWAKGLDLSTDARPVNARGSTDPDLISSRPRVPSSFLVTSKMDPLPDAAFGDRVTPEELAKGELVQRGKGDARYYRFPLPKDSFKLLIVGEANNVLGWLVNFSDDDAKWFVSSYNRLRDRYGPPIQVGWSDGGYRAVWTFGAQRLVGGTPRLVPSAQFLLDWKPVRGDHAETIAASGVN